MLYEVRQTMDVKIDATCRDAAIRAVRALSVAGMLDCDIEGANEYLADRNISATLVEEAGYLTRARRARGDNDVQV